MKQCSLVLRMFLAMVMVLSLVASLAPARPAQAAPPTPHISWSPCYKELGDFECGTLQVPIDYSKPDVGTISIAVVRLKATDLANRIGSLFFNPGGPGGSGVNLILFAGPYLYSPEVRARFDFVGFDPRGIGRSTALRCFGNQKQWQPYYTPFAFPMNDEEAAWYEAADRYVVDSCAQRGTRIIDYMSTGNTARDLDMLRQAVGDEKINYAGYSYGTFLGQVYANMYPDKIRAMVIDGVLDPIAWTTGAAGEENLPFSTRLRSDKGAMDTLNEFFRLCDANPTSCAFAGSTPSADRYAALAEYLKASPLLIPQPDGSVYRFTYQSLVSNSLGAMYDSYSWPSFAAFLAAIEQMAEPSVLAEKLQAFWLDSGLITKRGFPQYQNSIEGFPGVACADSDNPTSYTDWWNAAVAAEADNGYFGRQWTYASSLCAAWPTLKNGRYLGPFTQPTSYPVLVVGNLFDPATRYAGAQIVAGLLPNSRLITLDGWGHVSAFLSQCMDQAVSDYLLWGTLPVEETVCKQDLVPFEDITMTTVATQTQFTRQLLIHSMLPDSVLKSVKER